LGEGGGTCKKKKRKDKQQENRWERSGGEIRVKGGKGGEINCMGKGTGTHVGINRKVPKDGQRGGESGNRLSSQKNSKRTFPGQGQKKGSLPNWEKEPWGPQKTGVTRP